MGSLLQDMRYGFRMLRKNIGGALQALIGVGTGIAAALVLTRLMESFLFEVSPTDPATLIAVAVGMAAIALLATYVPARRATRVDPLVALRYE